MIGGAASALQIEPFTDLIFIYSMSCEACAAAEPDLDKFVKKTSMMVLRLQAEGPYPARLGIKVKATPTYVLRYGREAFVHVGGLTVDEIETWIEGVRSGERK